MLITLEKWIALNYEPGEAPTIGTVRRWAQAGLLPASKHGRAYFVDRNAVYTDGSQPLIDRLKREQAAQTHELAA